MVLLNAKDIFNQIICERKCDVEMAKLVMDIIQTEDIEDNHGN